MINMIFYKLFVLIDRDKRSSSRSGRRESEKTSKRTNSSSDKYWNNSGRDEDSIDRSRPKHSSTTHDGKGVYAVLKTI